MSNPSKSGQTKSVINPANHEFTIRRPLLWLILSVIVVYAGSLQFGFTELDDTIFIREMQAYTSDMGNLLHAFTRGLFNETRDTYYRPLLMDSFILNYQISGTEIKGYHLVNLLLHLSCVCLVFWILQKFKVERSNAFLLSLLFAVHPVLCQAVVWIPGRNDTQLALFGLLCLGLAHRYVNKPSLGVLGVQFLCMLAALFTKESGVFLAPAFFLIFLSLPNQAWKSRQAIYLYSSWLLAGLIWLGIRAQASLAEDQLPWAELLSRAPYRSGLALQYLGKVIFPLNLSVFPMQDQTTYWYGLLALLLLVTGWWFSLKPSVLQTMVGLGWYLLLLTPVFLLPASLNEQDFEHRLYLPLIGLLWVIAQTALFTRTTLKARTIIVVVWAVLLAAINWNHQQSFRDALGFWKSAVASTPKSSYAMMMLGARVYEQDSVQGLQWMQKAWQTDSTEKYVNYYLGKFHLSRNELPLAEKYLLAETRGSAYHDAYFLLSRLYFMQQQIPKSISFMAQYLEKDPQNPQALNNYVLMLCDHGRATEAVAYIEKRKSEGLPVPANLEQMARSRVVPVMNTQP